MATFEDFFEDFNCAPQNFISTKNDFLVSFFYQRFSLPNSIIYYIAKNPSTSKLYQKMIQICKYFFIKNPILTIKDVSLWGYESFKYANISSKLWITEEFSAISPCPNIFSSIFSKLYKCNVKSLDLNSVEITFNEFLLLSNSANVVYLKNAAIKYENGDNVEMEKLVENCSNAKIFDYTFSSNPTNIFFKTVKNLIKIPHFSTMEKLTVTNVPEIFDIKTLFAFIKKHNMNISLEFCEDLSEKYRCLLNFLQNKISFTESVVIFEKFV